MLGKKQSQKWRDAIKKANTGHTRWKHPNCVKNQFKKGQKVSPETQFKEGNMPWNKGISCSEETKRKISESKKGTISPKKGKKSGYPAWNKGLKGMHKHSDETKKKISLANKGKTAREKNNNWRGGISKEPYSIDFNDELKEKIRKRDNYRCQECFRHQSELRTKANKPYRLRIHHIDYNKKNNAESNLISLCMTCHNQTSFNREDWENYFKER